MQKIIIAAVYNLVNKLLERNVVSSIKQLVVLYSTTDIAGTEKKKLVLEELYKQVAVSIGETASYIISMAIDIAYAYLKVKKEIK